jgi:two-component system, chemotaxis family, chemotaxis protein CheY
MAYNFSALKVLVVDDSKYMRTVFREFLNALGVRRRNIVECPNGEDAMEAFHVFKPDMIITDFLMGPVDGLELTRKIRRDENELASFTPIIMCTGYTEPARVEEARDAGVHEVLAKPITAERLYARIRNIIDYPRDFERSDDYIGPDRRRRTEEVEDQKREADGVIGIDDGAMPPDPTEGADTDTDGKAQPDAAA